MTVKLLLLSAMAIGCSSGCMATIHPDGTLHAHYYAPPVVVEEPVIVTPAPTVIVERHRPVVYSRPARPVVVAYRSHHKSASKPVPPRVTAQPKSGHHHTAAPGKGGSGHSHSNTRGGKK